MKAFVRYVAVFIAFVVLSPHSYSQTLNKGMEGFTSVNIHVAAGTDCGVRESSLRS